MINNNTLFSNNSSFSLDFGSSSNFYNSTFPSFNLPPPPQDPRPPRSGPIAILNSALFHTLSRWILQKIQSYISETSLKKPLSLLENKTTLTGPLKEIITDIFAANALKTNRKLYDPLDVHLGFLIHCKTPLEEQGIKLPFTSEKMQFFKITKITQKELDQAISSVMESLQSKDANKQLVEFLFLKKDLDTPIAEACLKLFETLAPNEVENIKDEMYERMEKIHENSSLSDQERLAQTNAIQDYQKDQYVQIVEKLSEA